MRTGDGTARTARMTEVGFASKLMVRIPVRVLVPAIAWQFRFVEPELARLDEFVPKGLGAVDVGMWWGPWSWQLARRVPRVDSFEPNLDLVTRLAPVMPSNVNLHPAALSDRTGQSTLWIPPGGIGTEGRSTIEPGHPIESGWTPLSVATYRLDDFELGDVGFVKIDVEGHELSVLSGATKLLETQRPNVMVEVEQHTDRQIPLDTIVEFFSDYSYGGHFLRKGRWRRVEELDRGSTREMADRVARRGLATHLVLYARRYVHNFLFKPRRHV